MMTQHSHSAVLALVISSLAGSAVAQISLTPGNLTYSQDFDLLTRSATAENWVDNTAAVSVNDAPQLAGLPGWYAAGSSSYVTQIRASNGGNSTGSVYSYGSTSASDRALGTLPSGTTGSLRLGVRFVNDTLEYVDGFTFTYDAEQWREGAATAINNQYVVAYAVFAPGEGSLGAVGVFTSMGDALFNTPKDGTGVAASLDGNDAENRIAGLGATLSGLNVAPGAELWLRWFDSDSSGADHGIAIDNFDISFTTAVPEPTTATLLGLGLLLLGNRMRRS
jgi:hypothetical protein